MSELTSTGFQKLAEISKVSTVPEGEYLFREGDNDSLSIFLIRGRVEMEGHGNRIAVNAGTETACYALASLKPRRFTGRAAKDVDIVHVDSAFLEKLVAWDQLSRGAEEGLQVEELHCEGDPEWFLHMLGNRIFMRIPTANVEALVSRFEPVETRAGQTIIEQGEPGHDYFIIRRGTCEVLRKSDAGSEAVRIAERHEGEGVGEEALISDKPRDATVRMLTGGLVMRLSKTDFDPLLKEPLLNWVDEKGAIARLKEGAVLIDVRMEDEFRHGSLKGAINVPLYLFRLKADGFDRKKHYIVFCDSGERSATAAFLLGIRDLGGSVIRGGMNACARLSPPE
jgi:CRP-like cAMP-binding protein